jgi:hypothetical protein
MPHWMAWGDRPYFWLRQIIGYINFAIKIFIVIIRILKASTRFMAMYFPIIYHFHFQKKNTLYIVMAALILTLIIHLPFLIGKLSLACCLVFGQNGIH